MLRQSIQGLAVAAVATCALGPAPAAAVTPVSACGVLNKAGETYVLTQDLASNNSSGCLRVNETDRVTIDLAGHTITPGSDDTEGIRVIRSQSVVIKNGTVAGLRDGISFNISPRGTIRNVTVTGADTGIAIINGSSGALVKDCTVQDSNRGIFVSAGDSAQVEGCLIEGNSREGLIGGQRMLVTRNIIRNNDQEGIRVNANSTVTYNTVTNNGQGTVADSKDGISVGAGSLVTRNTSSGNGGDGIQATCPATITHNIALDNADLPINPPASGNGCVILHNITSDGDNCSASDSALAAAC